MGLLDYSLLLAVEKVRSKEKKQEIRMSLNPDNETFNWRDTAEFGSPFTTEVKNRMQQAKDRHRFFSTCGRYVYHISIIDYLCDFGFAKKFESFYKVHIRGNKEMEVSAINPQSYGERFKKFMIEKVIINEDISRLKDSPLDTYQKNNLGSEMLSQFNDKYSDYQLIKRVFRR